MHGQVLVLNGDYMPLNVTDLRRAVGLVVRGKAEVLEAGDLEIASPSRRFPAPSVIRLDYYIRKPFVPVKLNRRALFTRDGYRCQYCGAEDKHLTVDHIVPRARGGPSTWENLVTACKRCNNLKGGRSLEQSGMKLRTTPSRPHFILPNSYTALVNQQIDERWMKYLEDHLPKQRQ